MDYPPRYDVLIATYLNTWEEHINTNDINGQDRNKRVLLTYAIIHDDSELVSYLIKHLFGMHVRIYEIMR